MMKYRKKPLVVEVIQFDSNYNECLKFLGSEPIDIVEACYQDEVIIQTLESVMKARQGDWIIKGIKGEFYLCKPDIFEATYENVSNPKQ